MLYITESPQRFLYFIGAFFQKAPDTLKPNGLPIIQIKAAHAASILMWDRGPSGAPSP